MIALNFIIYCLAVWWLTKILTEEKGPYNAVEKFRNRIINEPWSPIYCFRCTSLWVAFFLGLLLRLPIEVFILQWFGASAAAILIHRFYRED